MTTCSARPAELERFAVGALTECDRVAHGTGVLTDALNFWSASANREFGDLPRADDQIFAALRPLRELAERVHTVGVAFSLADGRPLSIADSEAIGMLLFDITWEPKANVVSGTYADWASAAYGAHNPCASSYGYEGANHARNGFIKGPDGRLYPLVSPFVTRDGQVVNEDPASANGQGAWSLDGRDPGWVTTMVRTGVERWKGEPDWEDRLLTGIAATATSISIKSTTDQVKAVTIQPGSPPTIGDVEVERRPAEMPPVTDEALPKGAKIPVIFDVIPMVANVVVAVSSIDNGSHRPYQVVFQRNTIDGRIRAIYTAVGVQPPQKPGDDFVLSPVRIMGPEVNGAESLDRVVYAP